MGRQPVRVLLIEDSESDYLLTRHMLGSIENQIFDLEWASSWQTGIEAIRRAGHNICLLDYRIGGGNGLELLPETRAVSGAMCQARRPRQHFRIRRLWLAARMGGAIIGTAAYRSPEQ